MESGKKTTYGPLLLDHWKMRIYFYILLHLVDQSQRIGSGN